jgi:hypothetical protein
MPGRDSQPATGASGHGTQAGARRYGPFYWPLALTSLVTLLESQFQNGLLARYPNADVELATFALAASSFQLVNALLVFVPQMVTVLGRSQPDRAVCRRFVNGAGLLLSLPLLAMGCTAAGRTALGWLLNIPADVLPAVARYLQWLAPLVWVNAMRQYCTGTLVLSERTRVITLLNVVHLVSLVGVLLGGRRAGWGALPTLALATVLANVLHLALIAAATRHLDLPASRHDPRPTLKMAALWRFFWPLATTSALFAMSRPVLYAFVNLTPRAVVTIAALRVAFDFGLMFQNPVNQFRHLYATYGKEDPDGVARFMLRVTVLLVAVMTLAVFSPLSPLLFGRVLGLEGDVLACSLQAVRVLSLAPLAIALRNLYHGQLMVSRRTTGMALAALLRVLAIGLLARLLLSLGWLDHVSGAAIVVAGFAVEALMVRHASRRRRADAG